MTFEAHERLRARLMRALTESVGDAHYTASDPLSGLKPQTSSSGKGLRESALEV